MKPIEIDKVQEQLDYFTNKSVYIHLETTNGAYASHFDNKVVNVCSYIRNVRVTYNQAKIIGNVAAYRVGLRMDKGWIHAEGLTDWMIHEDERLLRAGHD